MKVITMTVCCTVPVFQTRLISWIFNVPNPTTINKPARAGMARALMAPANKSRAITMVMPAKILANLDLAPLL